MSFPVELTPDALTYCQAKLTWVGPQTKPIPTLVFSTFHRLPELAAFAPLRTPGLHYGNDEHAVWHFAVEPAEAARVLERLRGAVEGAASEPAAVSLMVDPGRAGGFEAVLDLESGRAAARAAADGLDESNGLGRRVAGLFREAIGG
jgi:hypothetical protein